MCPNQIKLDPLFWTLYIIKGSVWKTLEIMNKKYDSQSLKYNLKCSNKWQIVQIMTHSVKPIIYSFLEQNFACLKLAIFGLLPCIMKTSKKGKLSCKA